MNGVRRAAAILAVFALVVGACGGGTTTSPTPSRSGPATSQPTSAQTIAATAPPPSATALPVVRYSVALEWLIEPPYAPILWGREQGYFEDAGIDLDLIPGQGSDLAMSQINEDRVDFAFTDLDTYIVQRAANQTETTAVFVLLADATTGIAANFPIETLADMSGHSWGTVGFSSGNVVLPYILELNDVDPESVTIEILDFGVLYASLFDGTIDSAEAHRPGSWEQVMVEARDLGKTVHFARLADFGLNSYSKMMIVRNDVMESDPDLVRRMVGAMHRSLPEGLATLTDDQVFDLMRSVDEQADEEVTGLVWQGFKEVNPSAEPIDPAVISDTIERLQATQDLEADLVVEDLYTNEFLPAD
jgi:NitT/TauT family transport system substrate-binding protein